MSTTTIPLAHGSEDWKLPYHGTVGMLSLIVAETAIFTIFVVAYIYYIGKSLNGPYPRQVSGAADFQYRVPAIQQLHHLAGGARPEKKRNVCVQSVVGRQLCCWAPFFSSVPVSNGAS